MSREGLTAIGRKLAKSTFFGGGGLLFALSDGGTSRPADIDEQSSLAEACGLTSVWK